MVLKMYLFVDTETTGLPPSQLNRLSQWPRMVQLGWLLTDDTGEVLRQDSTLIRPDGFKIPQRVTHIHGITTNQAYQTGIPMEDALHRFKEGLRFTHVLIGHNIDYDYHVMKAEFKRKKIQTLLDQYPRFCTMKSSRVIEFCKVMRGDGKPKWPGLRELYRHLFHEKYRGAHDAYGDAKACAQCFFKLRDMGVI
ncbi:MAG: 3'-5' exonuclease [Thermoplasmatota archaeon]